MAAEHPYSQNRESPGNTTTADLGTSEDEALEQYGVWVKAGPVDVSDEGSDTSQFEISDLDVQEEDAEEISLTEEEEQLLGSLESDEIPLFESKDETVALDDLPLLADSEENAMSIGEAESPAELGELETDEGLDLEEPLEPSRKIAGHPESGRIDKRLSNEEEVPMDISEGSASILQKIEEDLLSIKAELTALKNEIYSLRGAVPLEGAGEKREEAESGFFAEDEDETIALTGDELDNILNTADITEQTGQSTVAPDDNELAIEDELHGETESLVDRPDIIDLHEEAAPVQAAEEPELSDLTLGENDADLAGITAAPAEELTLEERTAAAEPETDLLDLPEEEEIVLEELAEPEAEQEHAGGLEEIEIDFGENEALQKTEPKAARKETSFDLDEELELSPREKEDLEASTEIISEEELPDISGTDFDVIEPVAAAPEEEAVAEPLEFIEEGIEPPSEKSSNGSRKGGELSEDLKSEIRAVLRYMDQLLESLPEDKIEEFARSQYFDTYKRLFEELGLTT